MQRSIRVETRTRCVLDASKFARCRYLNGVEWARTPDATSQFWVTPERWIEDVSAGVKFQTHTQVLTIRFEDLINQFDLTIQAICEFLDLEPTSHFREYPKHATVTTSNAWFGPARPLSNDSIGKWKSSEFPERVNELLSIPDGVKLLEHFDYR
jgi:hypothetical protein